MRVGVRGSSPSVDAGSYPRPTLPIRQHQTHERKMFKIGFFAFIDDAIRKLHLLTPSALLIRAVLKLDIIMSTQNGRFILRQISWERAETAQDLT